jgi:hypothetical protein
MFGFALSFLSIIKTQLLCMLNMSYYISLAFPQRLPEQIPVDEILAMEVHLLALPLKDPVLPRVPCCCRAEGSKIVLGAVLCEIAGRQLSASLLTVPSVGLHLDLKGDCA